MTKNNLHKQNMATVTNNLNEIPIKKVSRGELLGWEDMMQQRAYTSSVRCISMKGQLFKIDGNLFQQGILKDLEIYK